MAYYVSTFIFFTRFVRTFCSKIWFFSVSFEKFYLACYVFHGLSETSEMVKTEPATDQSCSFKCLKFDYWVKFLNNFRQK